MPDIGASITGFRTATSPMQNAGVTNAPISSSVARFTAAYILGYRKSA